MGRIVLANYPHHVVQRGHNRQVVFAEPRDYERYLEALGRFTKELGVAVHAYCLMTNHVHLLLTPREPAGLGKLMKRLGGRQTRFHNSLEGRTGTLWEGRYHSSLVDHENYLLACLRYIELNPVRARIVARPEDYGWSSCRFRLGRGTCDWLDFDPAYVALGATNVERRQKYREFLNDAVPSGEWELIRQAAHRGQLTGTDLFEEEIGQIIGRRIGRSGPGRPKNKSVPIFEK
jgi:putative transposase